MEYNIIGLLWEWWINLFLWWVSALLSGLQFQIAPEITENWFYSSNDLSREQHWRPSWVYTPSHFHCIT